MSSTTVTRPARTTMHAIVQNRYGTSEVLHPARAPCSIVSLIASWLVGLAWPSLPGVVHAILAPHPVADLWLVAYLVTQGVPTRRPLRLAPAAVTA